MAEHLTDQPPMQLILMNDFLFVLQREVNHLHQDREVYEEKNNYMAKLELQVKHSKQALENAEKKQRELEQELEIAERKRQASEEGLVAAKEEKDKPSQEPENELERKSQNGRKPWYKRMKARCELGLKSCLGRVTEEEDDDDDDDDDNDDDDGFDETIFSDRNDVRYRSLGPNARYFNRADVKYISLGHNAKRYCNRNDVLYHSLRQ